MLRVKTHHCLASGNLAGWHMLLLTLLRPFQTTKQLLNRPNHPTLQERARIADSRSIMCSTYHNVICCGILLRHEHHLPGWACHLHLISSLSVAQKVGAYSLFGRIIRLQLRAPVGGPPHAEGASVTSHIVAVAGGGDGVQANRMRLAVLFAVARWDDTPRLTLPVLWRYRDICQTKQTFSTVHNSQQTKHAVHLQENHPYDQSRCGRSHQLPWAPRS